MSSIAGMSCPLKIEPMVVGFYPVKVIHHVAAIWLYTKGLSYKSVYMGLLMDCISRKVNERISSAQSRLQYSA